MKTIFFVFWLILAFQAPIFALTQEEIREAYARSFNLEKIKDYTGALEALKPVLEEYPNGYAVNVRCGVLSNLKEDYEASVRCYDKALSASPKSIEAMLGRTTPLIAQGKLDEALTAIHQVRSLDPNHYYANLKLVDLYRQKGKYILAEQIIDKMLKFYPVDIAYLTELGWIKHAQSDIKAAVAIFSDIQVLDPSNKAAEEYLRG